MKRLDNVGIVVEDIDAAIEFFTESASSSKGAPLVLGGGDEPRLALGVTVSLVERRYSVAEAGFGVRDGFPERDARLLFSVGIAIPSLD